MPKKYTHKKWEEEEIAYLNKEYTKKSTADIAKKLNRTISSIEGKAYNAGLMGSRKETVKPRIFLKQDVYKSVNKKDWI